MFSHHRNALKLSGLGSGWKRAGELLTLTFSPGQTFRRPLDKDGEGQERVPWVRRKGRTLDALSTYTVTGANERQGFLVQMRQCPMSNVTSEIAVEVFPGQGSGVLELVIVIRSALNSPRRASETGAQEMFLSRI